MVVIKGGVAGVMQVVNKQDIMVVVVIMEAMLLIGLPMELTEVVVMEQVLMIIMVVVMVEVMLLHKQLGVDVVGVEEGSHHIKVEKVS